MPKPRLVAESSFGAFCCYRQPKHGLGQLCWPKKTMECLKGIFGRKIGNSRNSTS